MRRLVLSERAHDGLLLHAAQAAPEECCGVLLGRDDEVSQYVPMKNCAASPCTAFTFDDAQWLRVAREADAQGLEVVGLAHSHLDAPAEPSSADRAFADATRWMLIVPVHNGRTAKPRAWQLEGTSWREAGLVIGA